MDKEYLAKGLTALSRSMSQDIWAAHWGAAVIAAYYFICKNELSIGTKKLVKDQIDSLIKVHSNLFHDLPIEPSESEFESKIISSLTVNIENLCELGHNVIFASLAIKASRDIPEFQTQRISDGICDLISAFDECTPGWFSVEGKQEVLIPKKTHSLITDINDVKSLKNYVLRNFLDAKRNYREERGDMQLGHILTHGQSIVELFELGYPNLAQLAFKPFQQKILLIEELRKRTPCNNLAEGVGKFESPLDVEYWKNDYSDNEWLYGHVFKYPYSFYCLLKNSNYHLSDELKHKYAFLNTYNY